MKVHGVGVGYKCSANAKFKMCSARVKFNTLNLRDYIV